MSFVWTLDGCMQAALLFGLFAAFVSYVAIDIYKTFRKGRKP